MTSYGYTNTFPPMDFDQVFARFQTPPLDFGPIPFWFWNDDLDAEELRRQLRAFHAAGFGGVLIHPRIGLSRRVGYLTDEYFHLVRLTVDEAARLEMKVILYDEGSYPSGSAQGAVVAENPDYASQAIGLWTRDIEGPYAGFWRPNTGRAVLDRHVCTAIGRLNEERIDPHTVQLLEVGNRDIARIEVGGGKWRAMSVWQTHSGGHIRGVFPEEESGHATAPAAGDILNPDAVACFIRLTHDRYYEHLKDHFGSTVIALFTDEPSVFGKERRRPSRGQPYTFGFADWLAERWGEDPRAWLPALWEDYGQGTEEFRHRYAEAVQARLHEVFYRTQSQWCATHGIALTGHPAASNEMSCLRYFQLPGQDMVWRWVIPGDDSGREGPHSLAPKVATSAARIASRERILTEVCGAYGWQLSLDEIKWLYDWHLARGNNLISPHACFYSLRDRRAWESEPDVGLHNPFWPYVSELNAYVARLSWLMTGGEQICRVAVLGDGNDLPWRSARQLSENQIDFLFVDDRAVGSARVEGRDLVVGVQSYAALVVEGEPLLSAETEEVVASFSDAGGTVLYYDDGLELIGILERCIGRDLHCAPAVVDLRSIHFRRGGLDFYLLFNEGEEAIATTLTLAAGGHVERWDPMTGRTESLAARARDGGLEVDFTLERRASCVLAVDGARSCGDLAPRVYREEVLPLKVKWTVVDENDRLLDVAVPGDWARLPDLELFSGALRYGADINIPTADAIDLDLGSVGDIAEVFLDGRRAGLRMWAPYRVALGHGLAPGTYSLEIRITNSAANQFEGVQLPSGLLESPKLVTRYRT